MLSEPFLQSTEEGFAIFTLLFFNYAGLLDRSSEDEERNRMKFSLLTFLIGMLGVLMLAVHPGQETPLLEAAFSMAVAVTLFIVVNKTSRVKEERQEVRTHLSAQQGTVHKTRPIKSNIS